MKTPKKGPKTPKNKAKSPKEKPKRRRKLPYICTGDYRLEEKLMAILDAGDQRLWVYVYRAKNCRPVGKYIDKYRPDEGLLGNIRDKFGSGQYAIIIRGKTMKFSGIIGIEAPIGWQSPE